LSQAELHAETGQLLLPDAVAVDDTPSFAHRGVLLDCARNFMPVPVLKRVVDGLMYSKMNVLHLHLSDSQSFPLQLTTGHGPDITRHGAYSTNETYSSADMADLVAYATARAVQLVPEIDTPGHARSFGLAPGLEGTVACADAYWLGSGCCVEPPCGQLNPASPLMYTVLGDVLADVASTFGPSSNIVHLGFDEVNDKCWTSDAAIAAYLKQHGMNTSGLLREFFAKERALLAHGKAAMYWDEVVTAGLHKSLQEGDIVQFWHDSSSGLLQQFLNETGPTNKAVISAYNNYYLDCGTGNEFGDSSWCDPYKSWRTMYFADPLAGVASSAHRARVIGGETTMWTEVASPGSVEGKLWPRTSAYGGRLWNHGSNATWVQVELGLAALATTLLERGINADQIMPEFCQHQPLLCFNATA